MADRVEQFEVVAPAGTPRTAPVEIATRFNPGVVEELEVVVPDGVAGLAGIALLLAHSQLIPITKGSFIISNDEVIRWPMDGLPNSGAWSCWVYNTDYYPHTFYVRFLVRELGSNITISEPTSPGSTSTIGVGSGDLGSSSDGSLDSGGDIVIPGDTPPPGDTTGDTTPPEDIPPPDDTTDTTVDDTPPPADAEPTDTQADIPPADVEPIDTAPPAPAPPPAPAAPPSYPLPVDYSAGAIPIFGNPGNLGMLIGTVLGYKQVGSGSNSSGNFNTWRFFSDLGNTADWNFYSSGAKQLQWVGPFNLRTGVPAG